jgi:hypothetical protein
MSLVGSLEDLGLTDILQIVSLARKSGRLLLRSGSEGGRIVLYEGLVRAAAVKGECEDLRGLLVDGGFVSPGDFERAAACADREELTLADAVARESGLAPEHLDSLRREQVERAIMRMFLWRSGEFSFEVRDEVDPEDVDLLLPSGINTQYLAMEATRMRDEGLSLDPLSNASLESDEDPVFSGESGAEGGDWPESPETASVAETIAMAAVRDLDERESGETGIEAGSGAGEASSGNAPEQIAVEQTPAGAPVEVAVQVTQPPRAKPVVAMDEDLSALEWFKAAVGALAPRVHIFQRVDLGVERIRQYLARGVVPLVVAAPRLLESSADPAWLARLRSLAPGIRVLALVQPDDSEDAGRAFDGVLERPGAISPEPESWSTHEPLAHSLRSALEDLPEAPVRPTTPPMPAFRASLDRLRAISDRMRDPSGSTDVLSLVLGFAAEQFSRVAILVIRDDLALGMARRGVAVEGGEGAGADSLQLRIRDLPELLLEALESRRGVCGGLGTAQGDLAEWLGPERPREAYVGPIESGGRVAALLYADHLPELKPIGDTVALEIVLHEAGLALDRAVLERALADAEASA